MLVHEHVRRAAEAAPDKVALVCGAERVTYRELWADVVGLAERLQHDGLAPGDRVVIALPNSRACVTWIYATSAAGGCFVVADPSTPAERLADIARHCAASVVVTPSRLDEFADAGPATPGALVASRAVPADPAAIIYTSGSTGHPKGVTLSHRNFDAVTSSVIEYLGHVPDDVVLSVLQLAFGYGLLQLLVTVRCQGRLVLRAGLGFPYDIVNDMVNEGVTGFAGVPTIFAMLLRVDGLDDVDLSLRYLTNAAAAMPPAFIPRIRAAFPGADLYLMYGQTECLRASYLPPDQLHRIPHSVGRGMPNAEVWVDGGDGRVARPGETGELLVRGPGVMLGYWNDPEATAAALIAEPGSSRRTLRTGDLFQADEDGWLSFVARTDDIIKSRGEKVSPVEVEHHLYAHDVIQEARVIGVPDELLGQAIRAEIVLRDGATLTARALQAYLRRHLEAYKVPTQVVFVDSLPKSASGKIKRT